MEKENKSSGTVETKSGKQNALHEAMQAYHYDQFLAANSTSQWQETLSLGDHLYHVDGSDVAADELDGKQKVVVTVGTLLKNPTAFAKVTWTEMVPVEPVKSEAPSANAEEDPYTVLPPEAKIELIPQEGVIVRWIPDENGKYCGKFTVFKDSTIIYENKGENFLVMMRYAQKKEQPIAAEPDYTVLPPQATVEWVPQENITFEWIPNEQGEYDEDPERKSFKITEVPYVKWYFEWKGKQVKSLQVTRAIMLHRGYIKEKEIEEIAEIEEIEEVPAVTQPTEPIQEEAATEEEQPAEPTMVEKQVVCRRVTLKDLQRAGIVSSRLPDDSIVVVLDNGHDEAEAAFCILPGDTNFVFDGKAKQFFVPENGELIDSHCGVA